MKKKCTVFVAVLMAVAFVLLPNPAFSEESVSDKLKAMRSQFDELRADLFRAERDFDDRYAGELKKLEKAATGEGKLDLVLAVRKEMESYRGRGTALPEVAPFPGLARLQKIYSIETTKIAAERATNLKTLVGGYRQNLEALKVELTKAKKIDDALVVQAAMRRLESEDFDSPPKTAPVPAPRLEKLGGEGRLLSVGVLLGKRLDLGAAESRPDVVEIRAETHGWKARTATGEVFYERGKDKRSAGCILLGRGNFSGYARVFEGGVVRSFLKKADGLSFVQIPPETYGDNIVSQVVSFGRTSAVTVLLDSNGDLHVLSREGGEFKKTPELDAMVAGVRDVVDIFANGSHLFALTREGHVAGWNVGNRAAVDLSMLSDIVAIDSHGQGCCALDRQGKVYWVSISDDGKVEIEDPLEGSAESMVRIWSNGDCGVAQDADGKLHAWAEDHAKIGFVEKVEALGAIKGLSVMDAKNGGRPSTYVLWIE